MTTFFTARLTQEFKASLTLEQALKFSGDLLCVKVYKTIFVHGHNMQDLIVTNERNIQITGIAYGA